MKIEIWSDIVCPWCYIGKRKFEQALSQFKYADQIEVEYKSYQLDPQMQTDTSISVIQYLSDKKGIPEEQAQEMSDNVVAVATTISLEYHMDKAIPINTLQAHGLLHYAKTKGKQLELKELLMKSYFTDGLNLDDTETLVQQAGEVGLDTTVARDVLVTNRFAAEIQEDITTGTQMGLRGVPFYVFDRKYGISGAQAVEHFAQTLDKAFADWKVANPVVKLETLDGPVCKPDGNCE